MAKPRAVVHGIAGRYASALFDLAEESDLLDAVQKDLLAMQQMLAASADLQRLVRSPVLARRVQANVLMAIGQQAEFSDLTNRFFGLLASNRRLFALSDIVDTYQELLADHRGVTRVEVTVASVLNETQTQALRAAFAAAVDGSDVDMHVQVDTSLIGGIVARIGSRMIDASIRSRLARMRVAMQEAN